MSEICYSSDVMRILLLLLIVLTGRLAFGAPPALPQSINPIPFDIVDTRVTNWLGSVSFAWKMSTESDLAGYRIYHGPASHFYTNMVNVGLTNKATLNLSRTNRHYFGLTSFNTAGAESDFATNELVWPNPLPPLYTNWVVIVPYGVSSNLNGPWQINTARLHYVSQTNGPMFWQSMPLRIERSP